MESTRLSIKGQIVIPKAIRESFGWKPGLEFLVEKVGDGIILHPVNSFKRTSVAEVLGCTGYNGPRKSLADMKAAIRKGVMNSK